MKLMKFKVHYLDHSPPNEKEGSITMDFKDAEDARRTVETNPNRKVIKIEPMESADREEEKE